jgi:hypothetical protein
MHIVIQGSVYGKIDGSELVISSDDIILKTIIDDSDTTEKRKYMVFTVTGNIYLRISKAEYQRIKSILQLLNGETIKAIEGRILNGSVKKEVKSYE